MALGAVMLIAAGCQTPEQSAAVAATVIATAGQMIEELKPVLSPEMQAKLQTLATSLDNGMQTTVSAVGILADAVAQLRSATEVNVDQLADSLKVAEKAVSELPNRTEMWLTSGGLATATSGGGYAVARRGAAAK